MHEPGALAALRPGGSGGIRRLRTRAPRPGCRRGRRRRRLREDARSRLPQGTPRHSSRRRGRERPRPPGSSLPVRGSRSPGPSGSRRFGRRRISSALPPSEIILPQIGCRFIDGYDDGLAGLGLFGLLLIEAGKHQIAVRISGMRSSELQAKLLFNSWNTPSFVEMKRY